MSISERESKIRTICRSCGHGGCGVYVTVKNGRATGIQPDKEHPVSKGYICAKSFASLELEYHPDRLLHPMKRIGKRGEGKWEKISWEEAISTIARKLNQIKQESGPESVVFAHGTGRDFHRFVYRVANLYGTPNIMSPGHMCYIPRVAISHVMGIEIPVCDYDNHPKCMSLGAATIWYQILMRTRESTSQNHCTTGQS